MLQSWFLRRYNEDSKPQLKIKDLDNSSYILWDHELDPTQTFYTTQYTLYNLNTFQPITLPYRISEESET